jgi:hypothetical protein
VQLDDLGPQLRREVRDARALVARHRDDDLIRLELLPAERDDVDAVALEQALDARARAHGQLEARRVALEVVAHLVLRGERVRRRGEAQPRQAVELGRREQAQRVPPPAPRVADALRRVEDDEAQPARRR